MQVCYLKKIIIIWLGLGSGLALRTGLGLQWYLGLGYDSLESINIVEGCGQNYFQSFRLV